MYQGYHGFSGGPGHQMAGGFTRQHQINTDSDPLWKVVHGKVLSSINSNDVFRGNEVLEVSVIDASLMDAPSVLLGRQNIPLQPGQHFPIRFQFYYDKSRVQHGNNRIAMQARITNSNGQLMYINDTHTPLEKNAKIYVIRVK